MERHECQGLVTNLRAMRDGCTEAMILMVVLANGFVRKELVVSAKRFGYIMKSYFRYVESYAIRNSLRSKEVFWNVNSLAEKVHLIYFEKAGHLGLIQSDGCQRIIYAPYYISNKTLNNDLAIPFGSDLIKFCY